MEKKEIEPCIIILFGATGDLTNRKLLPALYELESENLLHKESKIVAFARRPKNDNLFKNDVFNSIKKFSKFKKIDESIWSRLKNKIHYNMSEFYNLNDYKKLKSLIKKLCSKSSEKCNKLFYLAVPPEHFETIINNIKKSGLAAGNSSFNRIVFEKPFGHDLKSAKKLNKTIKKAFKENQIYRIDHYLGKELVQNLLVLRFANSIFDPIWNKKYIDNVQITVAEDLGVETRGNYYDKAGALRDILQNHMMQLLALTAMEPPVSLDADDIREEKVKVLRSIHPFSIKDVKDIAVRGQYSSGTINSKKIKAYKNEENVNKNSRTETFVALKLKIDNWRWANVPFYMRTGKRLNKRVAKITLVFKQNPCILFYKHSKETAPNMLIIRIQPEEGISLQFSAKVPGRKMIIDSVRMDFCHECKFGPNTPKAYERLIHSAIAGDQTLFTRWDEVEHSWEIVDKIAEAWKKSKKIPQYKPGTWGPKESDELIKKDGRKWAKPLTPMYSALLDKSGK